MNLKRKELAELLGVSAHTITSFAAKGMPTNGKEGVSVLYPSAEAVQWYIDYRLEQSVSQRPTNPDIPDREDSESILAYWKAEKEKNRALKEQGTLVLVEDATKEINTRLTQVRNALDAIPFSWSPFLVGLTELEEVQKQLSEQLDNLYNTLSSLPDSEEEAEAYEDGGVEVPVINDDDEHEEEDE